MEISVKDIFNIIKKGLVFILIVSIGFSCIAFFYTKLFVPKTYKATVKLYVKTSYEGSNGYESLQAYNYASKLVATYIEMLDTNSFYSTVAKALNDKYTATQLKSKISFSSIEDTEIFKATILSDNPTEAKNIADAVEKTAPETISHVNDQAQLKIVDSASVPTSPTSPNVKRNAVFAFIVGFVLSIAFVILRDYFDVKIKYNNQMTSLVGLPVLAAIPDFENYVSSNTKKKKSSTQENN